MRKEQLTEIVKELSFAERDAIESVIFNGADAETSRVDMEKLKELGLLYWKRFSFWVNKASGCWVYSGGPISDFFLVVQTVI